MKNWLNKNYSLDSSTLINKDLLIKYIDLFWDDIVNKLDNNKHILIILRLQFINDQLVTIGQLQKLNKDDKLKFINYLMYIVELKTDTYVTIPIMSIVFSYGIREGIIESKPIIDKTIKTQSYYNTKLPVSMNPNDYGKIINNKENQYIVQKNKLTFVITQFNEFDKSYNVVELYREGIFLYKWYDTLIDEKSFKRELGKTTYTYEDNELVLMRVEKPIKNISKLKLPRGLNTKIITMDIETVNYNNVLTPYLICWYDGIEQKSYFITDFDSLNSLLIAILNDLAKKKYDNYSIYLHNFSSFDGFFILKHLTNITNAVVDPIIHNDKIISITLNYNDVILNFKDSYLLLPSSLNSLCKSFNNSVSKDLFPVLFNDINHNGSVPAMDKFVNINQEQYTDYCSNFVNKDWNFKIESIKYCIIDCISLYEILLKFNQLIFDRFKININKYPTLPSLSFANYRTNYLDKIYIPCITGQIYNDIRTSYTGGSVDMFIPMNDFYNNELIYCYDVNALYPSVMINNDMPIGKPIYFQGNILKFNSNPFGFFYCRVTSPENLLHPIIQIHHKTNDGVRTLSPLGTFETMLFSEEMFNAMNYGYKFDVLWGYTFQRGKIFSNIINDLYNIRLNYPKSDPMNYIAKLLMNSLYGRFGMNDNFNDILIIEKLEYNSFESKFVNFISNVIDLDTKYLVKLNKDNLNTMLDNGSETHNVNIAIASAITGYARISMSQIKNLPDIKLFYSDTDSAYVNKPLPDYLVSNTELGKFKLENTCSKGIFLAPKVYGLQTIDNKTIIKVKGLTKEAINKISLGLLEDLLIKDNSLELNQEKWFKSLELGNITIKDQLYNLKVTSNKRELIYNNQNKLINTKPIIINN